MRPTLFFGSVLRLDRFIATCQVTDDNSLIPIGVGFKNVDMILFGDEGIIEERHVSGQIILGGNQLMEGYVNNLEIDQSIFVKINGKSFYQTGDFGYYDGKGDMVFEGRRDRRVKVNGNRFSLTTIHKALSSIGNISYAYVSAVTLNNSTFVVAAMTLFDQSNPEDDYKKIRSEIKSVLPNFMLPKYMFLFDRLPYKSSQKVDEKAVQSTIENAISGVLAISATSFVKI